MTKTNRVLLVGGALAYALLFPAAGNSVSGRCSGEASAAIDGPALLAWEQPPGVPPAGRGIRPKAMERPDVIPV